LQQRAGSARSMNCTTKRRALLPASSPIIEE
jgi:hypothetical protein